MKKILFCLCLLFLCLSVVNAEELNPNVDISEEGYEKLAEFMSDVEISMINQRIYDLFMNNEVVGYQSYIVEEVYMEYLTQPPKKINERYMTFEEYANSPSVAAECSFASDGTVASCRTAKKSLRLILLKKDKELAVDFVNEWLSEPVYKSFDVIGIRWTDEFSMNIYDGYQSTNGNTSRVNYNTGNGNYKFGTNAIGLSQNLVDSATDFENSLTISGTCNGSGAVWATYQHAQANITLATSKLYNFSSSGYGGVLSFYGDASGVYDNTTGLSLTFSC